MVTFRLPNFNKFTVTDKAKCYFPENEIGIKYYERENSLYEEYKEDIDFRLKMFEKYYIAEYVDFEYFGSISSYDSDIKIIELNDNLWGPLKAIGGLYAWKYPDMPEDLCFFSKGKCWLRSIAHEKECHIYASDYFEKYILKKIGIRYLEIPDDDIPTLNYKLQY